MHEFGVCLAWCFLSVNVNGTILPKTNELLITFLLCLWLLKILVLSRYVNTSFNYCCCVQCTCIQNMSNILVVS
jgi:hypothetical protein